ncbi:MAG: type III secretion system chaperone [Verrucomicrobium sp.]|nr:type III secretion system chaperone [Verrucomicrobium sp.]
MTLEELIHSAAAFMGMPEFQYSAGHTLEVSLPDGLEMVLEPSRIEDAVHIYAVVGVLPSSENEKLMETLLRAQLFHREVGEGCCFGLDEDTNELFLNRKLSVSGLDEEAFVAALNEFASWATQWRDRLQTAHETSPANVGAGMDEMQFLRA